MSGVKMQGDFDKLKQAFKNLSQFEKKELNEVLGETLKASTRQRFREEKDPDGERWKPSERARREGGKTLTDKAGLKGSIHSRATSEGVAVGTNDKRAATHQYGSEDEPGGKFKIKAKPSNSKGLRFKIGDRWVSKREVNVEMPRRSFLGINDSDIEEVRQIMQQALKEHVNE